MQKSTRESRVIKKPSKYFSVDVIQSDRKLVKILRQSKKNCDLKRNKKENEGNLDMKDEFDMNTPIDSNDICSLCKEGVIVQLIYY